MKSRRVLPRALSLFALAQSVACGDYAADAALHPEPQAGASFAAVLDGQPWTATAASTRATAEASGVFHVSGFNSAFTTSIALNLANIRGPGTYPLGVSSSVTGGFATVGGATLPVTLYSTPSTGAAGTVTLTAASASRIAGTFSFTATALAGGATGTKSVTSGHFDLPVVASASIDVPEERGGGMTGTIGTSSWNAASYFANSVASTNSIRVFAYNTAYTVTINISGYAGAGTYNLSTDVARWASVTQDGGPGPWGGTAAALSSGTFVVTSATSKRIKGTYNFSLHPASVSTATGDITMSGTFDLGVTPGT